MLEKQDMIKQYEANKYVKTGDRAKCACCGVAFVKQKTHQQFCSNTDKHNCKYLFHRATKGMRKPSGHNSWGGPDPKLNAEQNKRQVINDLKSMSRSDVCRKYGIARSTLYNYLIKWGCYSFIGSHPGETNKKLSYEEEQFAHEMYETMTHEEIAEKLEVSKTTISKLLRGNDSRDRLASRLNAEYISKRELGKKEVNKDKRYIVELNRKPTFIMVPVEEYLKEIKR